MKFHAQFFRTDLAGNLAEACGDRAVIILDGRLSDRNMRAIAADECEKRGYEAWQIKRGDMFTTARPVTRVYSIKGQSALALVSERINARKESQRAR